MTAEGDGLTRAVGAFQQRLLGSDSWRFREAVTVVAARPPGDDPDNAVERDAGSAAGISWYARRDGVGDLAPEVFLVDGEALVRAPYPALLALRYQGPEGRLQRLLRGRTWVRMPLPLLVGAHPWLLPAVTVLGTLPEPGSAAGWTVHDVPGRQSLVAEGDAIGRAVLELPGPERCPFPLPEPGQVMPAADLLAALDREAPTPPKQPRGYRVEILESVDAGEAGPGGLSSLWTLQDENLHRALGVEHNVEAEDLVREALRSSGIRLDAGVVFDSSGDCFRAYARSTRAAEQLARLVADLVARRSRGAGGH